MTIPVELEALEAKTTEYGWAYLLTVRDDGRAHVVSITPEWAGGAMVMAVGGGTARNAERQPNVSLAFPPLDPSGYSLIVDGEATVERGDDEAVIRLRPIGAVLHRPAPPGFSGSPTGCGHDCAPVI